MKRIKMQYNSDHVGIWRLIMTAVLLAGAISCSTIEYPSMKFLSVPTAGKTTIYGVMKERPVGWAVSLVLYERQTDKFHEIALPSGMETTAFAAMVKSGSFEVYSLDAIRYENCGQNCTQVFRGVRYLLDEEAAKTVKTSDQYQLLRDLFQRKDLGKFKAIDPWMKKLSHDVLTLPDNATVYIGEWNFNVKDFLHNVRDNKQENDEFARREFKMAKLDKFQAAGTSLPAKASPATTGNPVK